MKEHKVREKNWIGWSMATDKTTNYKKSAPAVREPNETKD